MFGLAHERIRFRCEGILDCMIYHRRNRRNL